MMFRARFRAIAAAALVATALASATVSAAGTSDAARLTEIEQATPPSTLVWSSASAANHKGTSFGTYASPPESISCPSTQLCAAIEEPNPDTPETAQIVLSTDPTSSDSSWTATDIPLPFEATTYSWTGDEAADIDCFAPSTCYALYRGDLWEYLLSTTDPAGGASAWHMTSIALQGYMGGSLSCPTRSLCVVGTSWPTYGTNSNIMGAVAVSTDPSGGASAWSIANETSYSFGRNGGLSCPTVDVCR